MFTLTSRANAAEGKVSDNKTVKISKYLLISSPKIDSTILNDEFGLVKCGCVLVSQQLTQVG